MPDGKTSRPCRARKTYTYTTGMPAGASMNNMIEDCPFCGTEIKPGAVVCRGCQAEKVQPGPGCFTFFFVAWLSLVLAWLPLSILGSILVFILDTIGINPESTLMWGVSILLMVLWVFLIIPTFRYTFRYVEKALTKRGFRSPRWQRKRLT